MVIRFGVVSMISALSAKTFRIWRIFRFKMTQKVITDFELVIIWILMVLPALLLLIIWTIVSTPDASVEDRNGNEHYVCVTGGFTGPPGGIVFFFVFVGYTAVLLLFGAMLSIFIRKVPSMFNESTLLAVSIYNLFFLSIVVIPVVMVLDRVNPFASWIIRTTAILYGFSATMFLQFGPKCFALVFIDHFRDVKLSSLTTSMSQFSQSAGSVEHSPSIPSIDAFSASLN